MINPNNQFPVPQRPTAQNQLSSSKQDNQVGLPSEYLLLQLASRKTVQVLAADTGITELNFSKFYF